MLDFSLFDCSFLEWSLLLFSAVIIGINKTALPGIGTLPVVLLPMFFNAEIATGLQLGMLCLADLMAVSYYRRGANWPLVLRLLPCALAGILLGSLTLRFVDTSLLRVLIGIIILLMAAVNYIQHKFLSPDKIPSHLAFTISVGLLAGFTTQVANAAGPIMAIYLLSMRLPKQEYMGTCAWYFMILNWIKLPIFISEGRIIPSTIVADLVLIPLLLVGAILGILFIRRAKQSLFESSIRILTVLLAIRLLFPFGSDSSAEPPPEPPENGPVPDTN